MTVVPDYLGVLALRAVLVVLDTGYIRVTVHVLRAIICCYNFSGFRMGFGVAQSIRLRLGIMHMGFGLKIQIINVFVCMQ